MSEEGGLPAKASDAPEAVSIRVADAPPELRELLLAVAWDAGASGTQEDEDGTLTVYAPPGRAESVRDAMRRIANGRAAIGAAEAIEAREWGEEWKRHLSIVEVSPRLRVRPSVLEAPLPAGQQEVIVEPGQAFGIGGHASTRLALQWVDLLCADDATAGRSCEWLDVGTGTGVLAIAALVLGAARATGCDIDPLASDAARRAASDNGLDDRLEIFCGSLERVRAQPFERVVANLLKREVLPLASAISACLAADGRLALAGLLDRDVEEVARCFAQHGLHIIGRLEERDLDGEIWCGLLLARAPNIR